MRDQRVVHGAGTAGIGIADMIRPSKAEALPGDLIRWTEGRALAPAAPAAPTGLPTSMTFTVPATRSRMPETASIAWL